MTPADDSLGLMCRAGLPDDLRVLYAQYPRGDWNSVHTIGQFGSFWLQRHDIFRQYGAGLVEGIERFKSGDMDAERFGRWFAPRLNHFLGDLDGDLSGRCRASPRPSAVPRRPAIPAIP